MKARYSSLVFLILVSRSMAPAQAGQSGLSFLKLGVGARSLAMGEAGVASSNDPSAMYYNPAALKFAKNPQVLIMHKEWIQGTQTEFLAVSFPVGSLNAGASVNATSVPDIEIRTRPGPAEGFFSARNAALSASAAYAIDTSLSVGLSLKYLYEKILVDETFGVAVDAGAVYESPWDITFGISLSNLGGMRRLRNEASKLPATVRFGAARTESISSLDGSVVLAADLVSVLPEKNTHLLLGFEFNYKETFAIRAGFMSGYESRNFTLGAGVHYDMFKIDYAFAPLRLDLGTTHTFSLGLEF